MGPGRSFSIFELEYIGCYFARKVDEQTRPDHIRKQIKLIQKKKGVRRVPVLLIVTASGAKVTDKRGQVVLIANSHFQIKYCAYLKEEKIFCFLSRESSRYEEVHEYIHIFTTSKAEVDELNENICNAFDVTQEIDNTLPAKATSAKKTSKISRSVSLTTETSRSSPLNHIDNLSASFTSAKNSSLASLASSEIPTNQQSSQSQSANGSTLHQLVVRSASKRMLKHSISAQAKLEGSRSQRPSSTSSQQQQTAHGSSATVPQNRTIKNNLNQPKRSVKTDSISKAHPSAQTAHRNTPVDFKYSALAYKPSSSATAHDNTTPNSSAQSYSNTATAQTLHAYSQSPSASSTAPPTKPSLTNTSDVYAKVRKTPSPRPKTPLHVVREHNSPRHDPNFKDPLAYLKEDESSADSPPLPESLYDRLPINTGNAMTSMSSPRHTPSGAMISSALPPPIAFSDYDTGQRRDVCREACKDYIDIDKASLNNNNSDTMSFYSDNYVRPGVLVGFDQSNSLSACIYSPGSSGVSINSIEGELMHGRPLPLTPEGELRGNGAVTPLRYQNDSPFVSVARATGTQSPNSTKRSTPSSPSAQGNQSVAERQRSAEELLKQVPWFKPKLSRELVLETLSREDLGSFVIRESTTHSGCFALSVKVPKFNNPTGIAHYIIHRTPTHGFRIKGLEKEWSNLSSLVIHHTIMPELLPCTLQIPHPVSTRRPSTTSRTSNSSRASSNSPVLSNGIASGTLDRLAHGLEKKLNITNCEGAV